MNNAISSSSDEETHNFKDQDRLLKNSNIYKQHTNTHISCQKHPNKKAKYYVQNDKRTLFCSKCALNLALRGHKIEETNNNQLEIQREMRIAQFEAFAKQALINCNSKIQEFTNLQIKMKSVYEEQKTNCVKFFEQVIETAHQLKQTYISKFQNDHQVFESNILDFQSIVTNYEKQLQQFQLDIEKNHINIVKNMEMKPFQEIMNKYESKVLNINTLLDEMKCENNIKIVNFESQSILTFMNKMCYNLLLNDIPLNLPSRNNSVTHNNNPSQTIDMKPFDCLETDDIYQSTVSNTIKEAETGNPPSPISKLPIYKSNNGSNPISTIMNSRRESHLNTPESWNHTNIQIQERESHQQCPSHNVSLNEQFVSTINQPQQKILVSQIKSENSNQGISLESTPNTNVKSTNQTTLKHQQQRNQLISQYDSVQNKSQEIKNRKKQPSVDQIEQKRFYIINQNNQKNLKPSDESLKDKIFKELSGHSTESVYNQVLKINNTTSISKLKKGKENSQFDWTSSLRNKCNNQVKK